MHLSKIKTLKNFQKCDILLYISNTVYFKKEVVLLQFKSDIPIYIQIATDIKEQILGNKFPEATKLPSIRELSVSYEVTALTVQRALQLLENEKVIEVKKGVGSFVEKNCRKKLEKSMIYKQTEEFIRGMKNMGLNNEEIQGLIFEVLNNE